MLCSKCNNFAVWIIKAELCKRCYKQEEYLKHREGTLENKKKYWRENKIAIEEKRKTYRVKPMARYRSFLSKCKFDGRATDIDFETFAELITLTCQYCDGPLNPTGCGLDRKDSSLDYTLSNVVPCCFKCNRVKGDTLTHDEMRIAMDAIMRYRKDGTI